VIQCQVALANHIGQSSFLALISRAGTSSCCIVARGIPGPVRQMALVPDVNEGKIICPAICLRFPNVLQGVEGVSNS
jgi:hypothetical protein